MLRLKQLYDENPNYKVDSNVTREIKKVKNFAERMNEAIACAELMADQGLPVLLSGNVIAVNAYTPKSVRLGRDEHLEFDFDGNNIQQCHKVTNRKALYREMTHILREIRHRQKEMGVPSKLSFSLDELGFETKTEAQLEHVERWLAEKSKIKPRASSQVIKPR